MSASFHPCIINGYVPLYFVNAIGVKEHDELMIKQMFEPHNKIGYHNKLYDSFFTED